MRNFRNYEIWKNGMDIADKVCSEQFNGHLSMFQVEEKQLNQFINQLRNK